MNIKQKFPGQWQNVFVVALLMMLACANPVAHIPEINPEQLTKRVNQPPPTELTYKMVPYDLLTVRFTYHPEQDPKTPVAIHPDGNIVLDGIGSVPAAGLTPDELGKQIAAKSSKRLKNPEVTVTVTKFAERIVYVGGQVKAPGIVKFQGTITPLQAIFDRGGFTAEAQVDSVILIRDTGSVEPIIGRINMLRALEDGMPEKIQLLTADVIYVPMTGIARADLWVRQHLREIIPVEIIGLGAYGAAS
jgi:protein involved in polysaccharide export with SLBB domain